MIKKSVEFVTAPKHFPEMIWIVAPLLITLLLMEFYFGRYSKEELGWNTAVGNSLVLIFVAIDLFRHIYGDTGFSLQLLADMSVKSFIATVIAIEGIWIFFIDFFHIVPKKFAFVVSSVLPINFTAYLAIVCVYSDILEPPTTFNYIVTSIAAIVVFIATVILFGIIHIIEPKAEEIEEEIEQKFDDIREAILHLEEERRRKKELYRKYAEEYRRNAE